jgi:hypothetical protein
MAGKDRANDGIKKMADVARDAVPNDDGNPHRDDGLNGQLQELLGDAQVLLGGWNIAVDAYVDAKRFSRNLMRSGQKLWSVREQQRARESARLLPSLAKRAAIARSSDRSKAVRMVVTGDGSDGE